jgi:hypothetical protein
MKYAKRLFICLVVMTACLSFFSTKAENGLKRVKCRLSDLFMKPFDSITRQDEGPTLHFNGEKISKRYNTIMNKVEKILNNTKKTGKSLSPKEIKLLKGLGEEFKVIVFDPNSPNYVRQLAANNLINLSKRRDLNAILDDKLDIKMYKFISPYKNYVEEAEEYFLSIKKKTNPNKKLTFFSKKKK